MSHRSPDRQWGVESLLHLQPLAPKGWLAFAPPIQTGPNPAGRLPPVGVETIAHAPRVLWSSLRIADLGAINRQRPEAWRCAVREAFQAGLAAGYHAVGLVRDESGGDVVVILSSSSPKPGEPRESL